MTIVIIASRGVPVTMQSVATTGNGLAFVPPATATKHTFYIKGADIPSAGAVQPESADDVDYAGTWAPIGGGPVTVPDGETVVTFEGKLLAVRCRITTNITSGTVTVTYVAE